MRVGRLFAVCSLHVLHVFVGEKFPRTSRRVFIQDPPISEPYPELVLIFGPLLDSNFFVEDVLAGLVNSILHLLRQPCRVREGASEEDRRQCLRLGVMDRHLDLLGSHDDDDDAQDEGRA